MTDRFSSHSRLQTRLQSRIVAAWKVDFSLLSPGVPLVAGTLPGGGTYTQAAGANQAEETWVTSWTAGTLARVAFVANTPKVGVAPNGLVGLRLRQSWKNYVRNSNAFDQWTQVGTAVTTANTTTSPDGSVSADTLVDNDAAGFEGVSATVDAIPNDAEIYRVSLLVLDTSAETYALGIQWGMSGGVAVNSSPRFNSNDGTASPGTSAQFGGWWWLGHTAANNASGNTAASYIVYPGITPLPVPGADAAAGVGTKIVYEASLTRGKMWREPQPTPAGTGATCADCAATYPASRLVRGGRLRLRFRWTPSGAPGDYNANFRLVDHGAETTYVEFSATDQKLRVVVAGGAAEVCAVPMWWPSASLYSTSHVVIEGELEIGGGVATRIRYRYSENGGGTWSLPFDPLGGAAGVAQAAISASGNIGVLTGASAGTVADGWLHEHEAILTAPAWALQWLPTDDANVKAWFRADGHYTLSAGLVSAWTSQTAAAVSATQGTGAFQPTFGAALVNGRPGLDFDGTNDSLALSGLALGAGDFLVSASLNIVATLGVDVAAILFDSLTGRAICAIRAGATADNLGYFDNIAWRSSGSPPVTGAQVLTYDLRTSPGGRVYKDGVLQGSAQTYSAVAVGGQTAIGSSYNNTGSWMRARLGDFIVASGQSDALRTNLHAFHAAKYSLTVA